MARDTTIRKLQKWYNKFQQEVDWITDGIIKFTMKIWKPSDEKKRKVNKMITVLEEGTQLLTLTQNYSLTTKENSERGYTSKRATK